jgi:Fe-S cluster biogenesis protein NfuA
MDVRERQSQAAQIEVLIQEMAAFPDPQVRAKTEELLHALLEMYGASLKRMLEITDQVEAAGQSLIDTFAQDELVGALMLLYGLHPMGLEERVHQALDKVRSSVKSQGGTIELLRIEQGIAYLRLAGSCHGCAASTDALKQRIESALYGAAPDLDEIRIEGDDVPQPAPKPVKFLPTRKRKENAPTAEGASAQPGQEKSQATVSGTR